MRRRYPKDFGGTIRLSEPAGTWDLEFEATAGEGDWELTGATFEGQPDDDAIERLTEQYREKIAKLIGEYYTDMLEYYEYRGGDR